jgi:hypothetical protein
MRLASGHGEEGAQTESGTSIRAAFLIRNRRSRDYCGLIQSIVPVHFICWTKSL